MRSLRMIDPPKHTPMRSCVFCKTRAEKQMLTRIVSNVESGVSVDKTRQLPGRGAYVCSKCVAGNLSKNQLEYALRTTLNENQWAAVKSCVRIAKTA